MVTPNLFLVFYGLIGSAMIAVIGIGQTMRGDDGVGIEAVRAWKKKYPITSRVENIKVELVENPGVGLLPLLEGVDSAILVDAVQSGADPGTLHSLGEPDIAAFTQGTGSAHGFGAAEALALGRTISLNKLPTKVVLIGIEIGQINIGESLSPEVVQALPAAADWIERRINELLDQTED